MGATTQETLDALKVALSKSDETLSKSITTANGLVAYDLQGPAKNLYPVVTPLRNSIPRVPGNGGKATNWVEVTKLEGSGFNASPWVPEGQRSARMSITSAPKAANYVTIGEEDSLTFEAESASKGFEDTRSTMAMRLLQKTMLKEEAGIIGGNASVALGTPNTPTVTADTSGGTIADGTYNVIVVALTLEGWLNATRTGTLAVPTAKTITGADGETYVLNGGSSNKSSAASTGAISGSGANIISASVPVVTGAVAYAWFVGTAGNETLQAFTTINSVVLTSLSSDNQNASAIAADYSRNNGLAFDGILATAYASGSAYTNAFASGVVGVGTKLTASGRGSIVEIDNMFKEQWDQYQIGVTVLYVNSQQLKDMTDKVLDNSSGPLVRYNSDGKEAYKLSASGVISYYFNPFTADGGRLIPVKLHPMLPPGTIIGYCEELPAWYQNNNVANVAEMHCRRDYYQLDYPLRTRRYETGVYAECVLAIYAPFATAVLTNIAAG
ncbi:hypothetical protein [Limnobacter litoralis]|uniref:Phage major capsid protein n=1 Tax=Limnobacter litoralis TaxID=481366 RepID=A0ABQ5YR17_9BURK|nr:hypothetical protein [Limnobacter litoralis]GLR26517.1 hypothetical protein GCM10007875_16070 [Limnobacter litoralis]